jgi:hypothetical protein
MAPLVMLFGLWYVVRAVVREDRAAAIRDGLVFAVCGMPAAIFLGATNLYLYGSPTTTGYGVLENRFAISYVRTNIRNYVGWFVQTATPLACVGALALLAPARSIWTGERARQALPIAAAVVAVVWTTYFVYEVWDAWWYLRFLLPSYPFILAGVGAVAAAMVRGRPRRARIALAAVVLVWGGFQIRVALERRAFDIWKDDRRGVAVADMVRALTDRDSLVFAGEHTGSLRFYGGRMTGYYLFMRPEWMDRSIDWLKEQEIHPYLLVEDWELPEVRNRFEGTRVGRLIDGAPAAVFREPGTIYLFDLLRAEGQPATPPMVWTGVDRSVWARPPASAPPALLGRLRDGR